MAVIFPQVQPWDLARMDPLMQSWYVEAAARQHEREHARTQAFLDALAQMLGGSRS